MNPPHQGVIMIGDRIPRVTIIIDIKGTYSYTLTVSCVPSLITPAFVNLIFEPVRMAG